MDEIIKVHRTIKSDSLKIDKLKKYIGRKAEVTIHIQSDEALNNMPAAGTLKKFANNEKKRKEKDAWLLAIKDKHDHR